MILFQFHALCLPNGMVKVKKVQLPLSMSRRHVGGEQLQLHSFLT
jgi:hypothetical protein